ncbi:MAG: HAMP domain-containing protein, partial [Candidatus Acidiferrales bacterium]
MHLRLKTKITLIVALLVLAVVGVNSALYIITLTRQVIRQTNDRATLVTKHIFSQINSALADSARDGNAPASESAQDLRAYVQQSLNDSDALKASIAGEVADSPLIYEVTISDSDGIVLMSSDASLPGKPTPVRTDLQQLVTSSFSGQLRALFGPHRAYEVVFPFNLGRSGHRVPFGAVRAAVETGLLRREIMPALSSAGLLALASVLVSGLLAGLVSSVSLAPLERISAQLDRISKGEFDQKPLERRDEFGQVSTKISQIGMQLRGVREIFSTLRENLDQVL